VVSVADTNGQAEPGLPVYAFNGTTYAGYSKTTNSTGVATFTLPLGDYHFRVDKNGTQFWSGTANHCPVPGCVSTGVTTSVPVRVTVLDITNQPEVNLPVYAFNGTSYTGYSKTTDATGVVTFTLPLGEYRFRADKNGTQFWSGTANHCPVPGCVSAEVTTTLPVEVSVTDTSAHSEAGLPVYAFNGTTYTGFSKTTNSSGVATFTLPLGEYRFRADKNGTQFWSGTANHCPVPGCTAVTLSLSGPALPPVADFTAMPFTGVIPLTVTFTNNSTRATTFVWTFGDGETTTAISPAHTYTQAGEYTVTLMATGPDGSHTLTRTHSITAFEPVVANFSASPLTGRAPLTVTFSNNSTGATDYVWDFGTGATLTVISPTYTYAQPGVYTVTLTANGPGGSDTLMQTSYITVTEPVVADFIATPLTGTVPLTVTFVNSSTGATDYLWDFGDGITQTFTSALNLPPSAFDHLYTRAGVYTVSLSVSNGDITDTLIRPEYITVLVETTPLAVIATSPFSNGLVMAPDGVISVTFSRAINSNTLNTSTFTVQGRQTGLHTGVYTFAENSVQFAPAIAFNPGEEIVVNLSENIQSSQGMTLIPYAWQFRAAVAGGVGLFNDSGQRISSTSLRDVAVGDLDGDGDLDAFVGNDDDLTVWLNNGTGEYSHSGQSLTNAYAIAVALGDLDNDGDLDAFVGNSGPNTIWLNDSTGNFSDSSQNLGNSTTYAVALGDLDGDGDLDAFVGDADGNRIWLNDGAGVFSDSGQNLGSAENYAVTLGDLDSDGDLDALVGNSNDSRIWLNDGAGTFSDSGQSLGSSYNYAVALDDLDSDGDLDAVVASYYNAVTFWLNDGAGGFSDSGQSLSLTEVQDIALGDVDADSDLDLLTASYLNQVWLNDGLGSFSSGEGLGNFYSEAVAWGDLDGDGDLDAFLGRYNEANQVWLNQLPFTVTTTSPSGNGLIIAPDSTISATFNRALNNSTVSTQTFTVRGSQTGGYTGLYLPLADSVEFTGAPAYKPGEEIVINLSRGLKAEDESLLTPYVWQFRAEVNGGAGLFVDSQQQLGNTNSYAVALGDLDSDSDLDAFVGNHDAPNQIWWGDGLGNFSDSGQSLDSGNTQAVALGDVDGDGDLDAFVGTSYYGSQVWLNDGLGSFGDSGQSLGYENNRAVALGDLDGDGDLDAFVANQGGSTVWFNDGLGSFSPTGQSLASSNTVALGDLDGDGDLDAFGGNYGGIIFLNDGSGNFSSNYLGGDWETYTVALGDLDGDADLDAFVGNIDSYGQGSSNEVWLNDGAGNFSDSGQRLGDANTYAVALGDLDGDGDLDVFAANYGQTSDGGGGGMGSISEPVGASLASTAVGHTFKPETAGFATGSPARATPVKLEIPQLDTLVSFRPTMYQGFSPTMSQ